MNERRVSKISLTYCLLTVTALFQKSILSLNVVASSPSSSRQQHPLFFSSSPARGGAATRSFSQPATAMTDSSTSNESSSSSRSNIFDAGEMVVDDPSTVRTFFMRTTLPQQDQIMSCPKLAFCSPTICCFD